MREYALICVYNAYITLLHIKYYSIIAMYAQENREMQLSDGRFLMAHKRYDELLSEHSRVDMVARKLVRVHEDFCVIALGLPVPRFPG